MVVTDQEIRVGDDRSHVVMSYPSQVNVTKEDPEEYLAEVIQICSAYLEEKKESVSLISAVQAALRHPHLSHPVQVDLQAVHHVEAIAEAHLQAVLHLVLLHLLAVTIKENVSRKKESTT